MLVKKNAFENIINVIQTQIVRAIMWKDSSLIAHHIWALFMDDRKLYIASCSTHKYIDICVFACACVRVHVHARYIQMNRIYTHLWGKVRKNWMVSISMHDYFLLCISLPLYLKPKLFFLRSLFPSLPFSFCCVWIGILSGKLNCLLTRAISKTALMSS